MRTERARLWKYFLPAFFFPFAMKAVMAQVETATLLGAFAAGAPGVILSRKYSEMRLANLGGAGHGLRDAGLV